MGVSEAQTANGTATTLEALMPVCLAGPFRKLDGFCWFVPIPTECSWASDTNEHPRRSFLGVWEDAEELGPPHEHHQAIATLGRGRYSVWKTGVLFSTSDNSDPNSNGRSYFLNVRTPISRNENYRRSETVRHVPSPLPRIEGELRLALIGAGNRGVAVARLLLKCASVKLVAVAESDPAARERLAGKLPGNARFVSQQSIADIAGDKTIDGVIIASPDMYHERQAVLCLNARKHVFLEKPLATTIWAAQNIARAWKHESNVLHMGFVLRHAPFFRQIKQELEAGSIGEIQTVHITEHLGLKHGASYWRRWHASARISGGLVAHKACHDIDVMLWLVGEKASRVASFGGSQYFARLSAPATHCHSCALATECMFFSPPDSPDTDGCVYGARKDIVDNQSVIIEFANGIRASYVLDMFGPGESRRSIRIVGLRGAIEGSVEEGVFSIDFNDGRIGRRVVIVGTAGLGHFGGDLETCAAFLNAVAGLRTDSHLDIEAAVQGVEIACAAEASRETGQVMDLEQLRASQAFHTPESR